MLTEPSESGSNVHPIEAESFRILDTLVDLSHLRPIERAVVSRVIHASADLEFATSMVLDESSLELAVEALRQGAVVVTDVEMVRSGLHRRANCYIDRTENEAAPTRSAAAMRIAVRENPSNALFVIGCAPSALTELVDLATSGMVEPVMVVGMPVGFVGAAESKQLLRDSGIPAVSNIGEKGGSAVAAAAVNALLRAAGERVVT